MHAANEVGQHGVRRPAERSTQAPTGGQQPGIGAGLGRRQRST
jgi:hypothetical protein